MRREIFMFWDWVRLILDNWRYNKWCVCLPKTILLFLLAEVIPIHLFVITADAMASCMAKLCGIVVRKIKLCYVFSIISLHRNGTSRWNPSPWKSRARLPYTCNTIADYDLVMREAKASATMVLIWFSRNIQRLKSLATHYCCTIQAGWCVTWNAMSAN